MKEYNVGDTIYVKGKVNHIDNTALPYCVDFVSSGSIGWITGNDIIGELSTTEPVKPVLPKEVADAISFAKFIGVTFDRYIARELTRSDYKDAATYTMIQSPDVPNAIEVLLNAWNNGYTVEEKIYNVKVPYAYDSYFYKVDDGYCDAARSLGVCLSDDRFRFTDAEIEHYGLQDCEKEEVADKRLVKILDKAKGEAK